MAEYAWHEAPVPAGWPVRQVHGWLADATGRVLVQDRVHERRFLLAGGKCDVLAMLLRKTADTGTLPGTSHR